MSKVQEKLKAYAEMKRLEEVHLHHSHRCAEIAVRHLNLAMELEDRVRVGEWLVSDKGQEAIITGRTALMADGDEILVAYYARRKLKDGKLSDTPSKIASGKWKRRGTDELIIDL